MTFTHELYERTCDALPGTTTRRFSRYCGKSEGYFGSICAQQLPISTNAIIHLAEMIERMMVLADYEPRTNEKLRRIQAFIATEVARRTQELPIVNLAIRQMVARAVASAAYTRDQQQNLPPIVIG